MGGGLFEDGMSPRPHASLVDFGDHQESCNVVLWNFTGEYFSHVVSSKESYTQTNLLIYLFKHSYLYTDRISFKMKNIFFVF